MSKLMILMKLLMTANIRSEKKFLHLRLVLEYNIDQAFEQEVEYLNSTDDGEPSEQSHGSSNSREHFNRLGCTILGDPVKCWGVKVNSDHLQIVLPLIILIRIKIIEEGSRCNIYLEELLVMIDVPCISHNLN